MQQTRALQSQVAAEREQVVSSFARFLPHARLGSFGSTSRPSLDKESAVA